ncbi:DUF5134 domain-containing protein [Wenjunlia tyrosinilytica]|uniref:DUF5134 domain-containing protein n=1 Tax=Wenjunlia tyrosinilytica TaxID=1544741 RepID=A0A918DZW3_9ACTN|nr:DUF5134 domain-containing protein [Wenjunlia tyrosinilytica]GGO91079.1 DUF5134 domain-containing protein [Wenjunlia tyrosinilytica]
MHGPPLVGWLLVALTGASGVYCLARMRGARGHSRRAAGSEALMGLGMAAMALPAARPDPQPYGPVVFAAVFALLCAAALGSAVRAREAGHRAHHVHHAVGTAAMVYMALAMAPGATSGHHHTGPPAAPGIPVLTGLLLAYFALYALRTGARMVATEAPGVLTAPVRPSEAPALSAACRVSMGIGMFAMLLTM